VRADENCRPPSAFDDSSGDAGVQPDRPQAAREGPARRYQRGASRTRARVARQCSPRRPVSRRRGRVRTTGKIPTARSSGPRARRPPRAAGVPARRASAAAISRAGSPRCSPPGAVAAAIATLAWAIDPGRGRRRRRRARTPTVSACAARGRAGAAGGPAGRGRAAAREVFRPAPHSRPPASSRLERRASSPRRATCGSVASAPAGAPGAGRNCPRGSWREAERRSPRRSRWCRTTSSRVTTSTNVAERSRCRGDAPAPPASAARATATPAASVAATARRGSISTSLAADARRGRTAARRAAAPRRPFDYTEPAFSASSARDRHRHDRSRCGRSPDLASGCARGGQLLANRCSGGVRSRAAAVAAHRNGRRAGARRAFTLTERPAERTGSQGDLMNRVACVVLAVAVIAGRPSPRAQPAGRVETNKASSSWSWTPTRRRSGRELPPTSDGHYIGTIFHASSRTHDPGRWRDQSSRAAAAPAVVNEGTTPLQQGGSSRWSAERGQLGTAQSSSTEDNQFLTQDRRRRLRLLRVRKVVEGMDSSTRSRIPTGSGGPFQKDVPKDPVVIIRSPRSRRPSRAARSAGGAPGSGANAARALEIQVSETGAPPASRSSNGRSSPGARAGDAARAPTSRARTRQANAQRAASDRCGSPGCGTRPAGGERGRGVDAEPRREPRRRRPQAPTVSVITVPSRPQAGSEPSSSGARRRSAG